MKQSQQPIRVAVVENRQDDLEIAVETLRSSKDFVCVATCRSAKEALETLPRCRPEVILMDINLLGLSGIDCLRQLQPLLPDAQVMMWTVYDDHDLIFRSLAAGATGYLLKKTSGPKLLEAIRELHEGGAPMSGQIARQVVSNFRRRPAADSDWVKLSPVEQAALEQLAHGLLYKEVAEKLGISVSTVRTHVWHIYRKLQVHNRTEAILKGLSRGRG